METPSSSSRRIPRSRALAMATNEESEKRVLKSRSALIDITNDSPIIGLAIGSLKTPSSTFSKKRTFIQNGESKQATTPGSGEALLRGQVKTLLQKVEEEAVISKISFEPRNLILEEGGFVNSPMYLLAPTPANTPQVSEILDEQEEDDEKLEVNSITKLVFTDNEDDDDESVCSIQVNLSTSDEELEESFEDGVDEFSEGLSKICVNDEVETQKICEVSNIRDVPDHQSGGVCGPPCDEILIFELLELKHDVADNGSGTWFLQDLLGKREDINSLASSMINPNAQPMVSVSPNAILMFSSNSREV
ncbi:hypothetical protein L2E82_43632 [Cichorium intybus]|uniref:Uncharacterized protein n=1 Tax=Cichorium intybus TaxID=13427 RepID=A0ACB8ZPX4_CICIN|nr:hypothetical protein L2E82_43632 [Cichorium intybus]